MNIETTSFESKESAERGENVKILLRFMRHGERDLDGNLVDYGREITRQVAKESDIKPEDFDAVKAIGSDAGPLGPGGMQRSLETVDIYAHEIAGEEAFNTRVEKALSYESLISPLPHDYNKTYKANIPSNFDDLTDEEKKEISKKAQEAVMNELIQLDTPEAIQYKKEAAGALASVVVHYIEVAHRLKSGSRVLLPAGTHGGVMEFLLEQALIRKDDEGNEILGFKNIEDIGGAFSPSESYDVDVQTDENGKLKPITVNLGNRREGEFSLKESIVRELAEFYDDLHRT
jgi:hypothetical protein